MNDDEVLDWGRRKLRFLITPHVPHAWDAILAYEETTGTLLASDLSTVFGEPPPTTESDVVEPAMAVLNVFPDYLPIGSHTGRVFDRLEALKPKVLAGHHAPALHRRWGGCAARPAAGAIRKNPLAFSVFSPRCPGCLPRL